MFTVGGTLAGLSFLGVGLAANSAGAEPRPEPITQGSIEDVETGAACGFEEESAAADAQNLTGGRLTLRIDYLNDGTVNRTQVLEPQGDEDNRDQETVTEDESGPEVAFTVDDKEGKFVAKYYPCHVEPTPSPTPEPTTTSESPSPTHTASPTPEPTSTSESPSPTPKPTDTCIARIATLPPNCETPTPTPTSTPTPTETPTTTPKPTPSTKPTPTTTVIFTPKPKPTSTPTPTEAPDFFFPTD